jgi:hypothetical protein
MPRSGSTKLGRGIPEIDLNSQEIKKSLWSPNPDIIEDRKNAIELIQEFDKEFVYAKPEDIQWFWRDMDIDFDKVVNELAKEVVELKFEKDLALRYPFGVSEWLDNWYRFMPEIIGELDNTGQVDWNLFFSLVYPLPPLTVPFNVLSKKLNIKWNRVIRDQIYWDCYNDPVVKEKLIKGEIIPSIYTYYTSYSKIRNEVMKKIDGETKELFALAKKLIKEKGLDDKSALEEAHRILDPEEKISST